jgi:ribosome-binding protein aMBF1 (putative translation factor)
MMSPSQSRTARAWLDWSEEDLAERSNLSASTVKDFENGHRAPIADIKAIERAFLVAGIRLTFHSDGTPVAFAVSAGRSRWMI